MEERRQDETQQERVAFDEVFGEPQQDLPDPLADEAVCEDAQEPVTREADPPRKPDGRWLDDLMERAKAQQMRDFARRYPEVRPEQLPESVLEAAATGGDMALAYQQWRLDRLIERLDRMERESEAVRVSAGPAAGEGEAAVTDEGWQSFLRG